VSFIATKKAEQKASKMGDFIFSTALKPMLSILGADPSALQENEKRSVLKKTTGIYIYEAI